MSVAPAGDLWVDADPTVCPVCDRDACEEHLPRPATIPTDGLNPAFLCDGVDVVREGQQIARDGIRYLVPDLLPNYGVLGMLVAYAKVGKTTFGQRLAAAVAMGQPFLDRDTVRTRVLDIAAEDPPEYTAYLARTLELEPGRLTFSRAPMLLNAEGLDRIAATVRDGAYGLVLIASWQAVVRGLVKDENDNAGTVAIVESVKAVARQTGVPWLIDAHSGKGEDMGDDADPSRAMRGASAAAGAADFTLSLRYAEGAFSTKRRLSGKGRFLNLAPLTLDLDSESGAYVLIGETKRASAELIWTRICEAGALHEDRPQSTEAIAMACGLVGRTGRPTGSHRRQVQQALRDRPTVGRVDETRRGGKATLYRLLRCDA